VKNILESSNDHLNIKRSTFTSATQSLKQLISPEERASMIASSARSVLGKPSKRDNINSNNNTNTSVISVGKVITRRLKNGMKVNILQTAATNDKNEISLRLEVNPTITPSVTEENVTLLTELGVRMLQSGGPILNHTSSEVELFCIENDISVDAYMQRSRNKHVASAGGFSHDHLDDSVSPIPMQELESIRGNNRSLAVSEPLDDSFIIDVTGPITSPHEFRDPTASDASNVLPGSTIPSGAEAVFQLLYGLMRTFRFSDESVLGTVMRDLLAEQMESKHKLESVCLSEIQKTLFGLRNDSTAEALLSNDLGDTTPDCKDQNSIINVENVQRQMSQLVSDPVLFIHDTFKNIYYLKIRVVCYFGQFLYL
jgi:hypothetical protein